jgi:hypothetical protein
LLYVVSHIAQEAVSATHDRLRNFHLPFDDQVRGIRTAGAFMQLAFESNRWFEGDATRALPLMEEEYTVVDAATGYPVAAPSDQREPEEFAGWVEDESKCDFGLSRDGGCGLVAVRGAKLALLNVGHWMEVDAITDESLRAAIMKQDKKRIELTAYYKAHRDSHEESMGPYIGVLTKEGRLAVVHVEAFSGPDEIAYRVRPRLVKGV